MRWLALILLTINMIQAVYIFYPNSPAEPVSNQINNLATDDSAIPLLQTNVMPKKPIKFLTSKLVCNIDVKSLSLKNDEYFALLSYDNKDIEANKGKFIEEHVKVHSISSFGVVLHYDEFQQFLAFNPKFTPSKNESHSQEIENIAFPFVEPVKGFLSKNIPGTYKADIIVMSENVLSVRRNLFRNLLESTEEIQSVDFAVSSNGGFQATKVAQDGLFSSLGIETGDIIKAINNKELNSISDVVGIYQQLDNSNLIELRLERQGQKVYYFYQLND